jgi:hypothetical protein
MHVGDQLEQRLLLRGVDDTAPEPAFRGQVIEACGDGFVVCPVDDLGESEVAHSETKCAEHRPSECVPGHPRCGHG